MDASIPPQLIDFHSHYCETGWTSSPLMGSNVLTQAWPLLTDIQAQLAIMDEAGIDAKVLSAPASVLKTTDEQLPSTLIERINDRVAEYERYLRGFTGRSLSGCARGTTGAGSSRDTWPCSLRPSALP